MTTQEGQMSANIFNRMVRAAKLDSHLYEEVELDASATTQALLVVIITSLAAGIGSFAELGLWGFVSLTVAGLVGWALYAGLTYVVGTRLLAGPETRADWGELARTLGFANTPRLLLILGIIPILAGIVGLIVLVWVLVATVIAVRAALDFSTGRAIGTAVIAWLAQAVIMGVVYALLAV